MHILILKNGEIFARTTDNSETPEDFSIATYYDEEIPAYPEDGHGYELKMYNGSPVWARRPANANVEDYHEALEEIGVEL